MNQVEEMNQAGEIVAESPDRPAEPISNLCE